MGPEVENIIYSDRPVTGISPDMTHVYRLMTQQPQNIRPVVKRADPLEFPERPALE